MIASLSSSLRKQRPILRFLEVIRKPSHKTRDTAYGSPLSRGRQEERPSLKNSEILFRPRGPALAARGGREFTDVPDLDHVLDTGDHLRRDLEDIVHDALQFLAAHGIEIHLRLRRR